MSDNPKRFKITLDPSMRATITQAVDAMGRFMQDMSQASKNIARIMRDIEIATKHGRLSEETIDDMTPVQLRVYVAAEIEAESQSWEYFRKLQGLFVARGMSKAEASEEIRKMTHHELAESDMRPRDHVIRRLCDQYGRAVVKDVLGMGWEALRQACSRGKPRSVTATKSRVTATKSRT